MAQQAFYTKINAGAGVQFSGGTIAQATAVLHTNNVLYIRGGSSGLYLQNADGSDGVFAANDHVQITTANAERLRVTSAGFVGIGTTSPVTKLDVYGTSDTYLTVRNSGAGNKAGIRMYGGSAGISHIWHDDTETNPPGIHFGTSADTATTPTTQLYIKGSNGYVGIGTTSPASILHINTGTGTNNANTVIIDRPASSDYSGVSFATAGTVDWSIGQNSAGNLEVFEDGQDAQTRVTVNTGGNVGIGTVTPNFKLDVSGDVRIEGTNKLRFGGTGSQDMNFGLTIGAGGGPSAKFMIENPQTNTPYLTISHGSSVNGQVRFDSYGSGSFTGTAAYNLQVDSSGNIIEGGLTSGTVTGSGTATYLPIWTGSSALGNSIISSSGGDITINGSDNDPRIYINPLGGDIGDTALIQFNSRGHVGYTSGLVELGDNGQSKDVRLRVNTADIIFQTSNTTRMTVKTDGKVGIGTSSPGTSLDIQGTSAQSLRVKSDDSATIIIDSDGDNSGTSGSYLHYRDTGATKWTLYKETNNDFYLHNAAASTYPIHAQAGGNILLMEDGNNLGIGAGTPAAKLDVNAGAENFVANFTSTDSIAEIRIEDSSNYTRLLTVGTQFKIMPNDGSEVLIVDGNNDRVGIGNSSPQYTLDVAGVIKGTSSIRVDAGSPYFGLYQSGTEKAYLQWSSSESVLRLQSDGAIDYNSGGLQKWTISGSEKMTLNTDGELGINQSNPRAKLEIYNTAVTSDTDYSASETPSGQDSIILYTGGTAENTYGSISWVSGGRRRAMITAVAENADTDYQGIAFYTQGTDGSGDFYESMRIKHSGQISFYDYRGTNNTGTPTYLLGTDANGLMVKTNSSSHLPGGPYLPLSGGTMSGNIAMGDNDITGVDKINFTDGIELFGSGSNNYLKFKSLSTNNGGILFQDGDSTTQGYLYYDGGATASIGFLDGSGSWAVKCKEDAEVELRYDNSKKFETTNTGITAHGTRSIFAADTVVNSFSGTAGVEVYKNAGDSVLMVHQDDGNYESKLHFRTGGNDTQIIVPPNTNALKITTETTSDALVLSMSGYLTLQDGISATNTSFSGTMNIAGGIYHIGDTDTFFGFIGGNDTFGITTGGGSRMDANNAGVRFGGSGARIGSVLDEDNMASDSATALATQQSIKAYVDASTTGVLTYQGTWNADTNSPTLSSGSGTPGYYYIVSVAGSTNLDGITDWAVGDWAVFSDQATDAWQKIDNTAVGNVSGSGVSSRVTYWNGTGTITSTAGFTFDGSNLAIPGYLTISGNQIVSPSNLTIDVGGDITLDADGGDIWFKDNGTDIGLLANTSSNFVLMSRVSDKDIIFKGNDGGSTITALTLDMSDSGAATFAGDIKQSNRIVLQDNGTIQWGANADYGNLSWDTGYALIYGQSGKGIKFGTNGSTLALTLDTSQNALFTENLNVGYTSNNTLNAQVAFKKDDNVSNDANSRGLAIDYNLSGTTAQTADRFYDGLFIDADSSATGGDATNEVRFSGIRAMVEDSGDANDLHGGYFQAVNDRTVTSDVVANVFGTYSLAYGRHTAGEVKNIVGVQAYAYTDNADSGTNVTSLAGGKFIALQSPDSGKTVNNAYGVYGKVDLADSSNNGTFTSADGVLGEVEIDDPNSTISHARAVKGVIDSNAGTITSAYQFHGSTTSAGTITNNWGIYSTGALKNYLDGTLQLGSYGAGTLVTDASGNITVSSGGGAGGPYLPLAGGTLTGALTGTTATFLTGSTSGSITVGRNANENTVIHVGDQVNSITAYQDSDGDATHNFTLNRVFAGTGANDFIIQKDGTAQFTLDTSANATFAGSLDVNGTGNNTFTGNIIMDNAAPILQTNSSNAASGFRINVTGIADSTNNLLRVQRAGTTIFDIRGNANATFTGDVTLSHSANSLLTVQSTDDNAILKIDANSGGTGTNANQDPYLQFASGGTIKANIHYDNTATNLIFQTNTNATALTIDNSQNATFAGNIAAGDINNSGVVTSNRSGSSSPNSGNTNFYAVDTRSYNSGEVGGSIVLSGKYNNAGAILSGAPFVKGYKVNNTDGDYGFGIKLGVRENGSGSVNTALTIDSTSNATFAGDVTVGDELTITTISNATADPDKFLCASSANKVGYRTGAQVLSDIGAAPATGGAYLPLAGGTMTGDIVFNDNVKASFGTGSDLKILHDGTDSGIINESGDLSIQQRTNDGDIIFSCDDGLGGITEYFRVDGSNVNVSISKQFNWLDSVVASFGNSADLQIFHNSTDTWFDNYTGDINFRNRADGGDIIFYSDDGTGGVIEYLRLDGSTTKITINKEMQFFDNVIASFGNAADLKIYHDASHSYIKDSGTGDLVILSNQVSINNAANTENIAKFIENGAVDLYYDNVRKFSTGATGITIQGNSNDITFVNDSATDHNYLKVFVPDTTVNALGVSQTNVYIPLALEVDGVVTLNNNLQLQDSDKIQIGNSQDLEIYHSSGTSYIDNDTGHLYIRNNVDNDDGSNIYIQAKSGENSIICNDDSSVVLYNNNSAKFYTTTSGVGALGYYGFGSAGTSTGSTYYFRYGSQAAGATQGLIITTSDTGGSYFDGVAQFRNTNTGQGANMFQMINYGSLYGRYMNFYRGSTSNIIGYIGYNSTNTAVTYSTSSSDIRLKKNIVDWSEDVLPKFLALTPKKFDFKAAIGDKGADKVKGFIAQYETENFPEVYQLNGEGQDARYGFHPMEMVPYLMKAVKELAQKNEDLERRLAALEK